MSFDLPMSEDVYKWEQTKALLARLGVDYSLPMRALKIELEEGTACRVTQEFYAQDMKERMDAC